jgi:hypothetical protein
MTKKKRKIQKEERTKPKKNQRKTEARTKMKE